MKVRKCRSGLGTAVLFAALTSIGRAQFPVPTILRTENPWREGHFGQSCAIDNGIIAVSSEARYLNPLEYGSVAILERGAQGDWVQTQLLRRTQGFPLQISTFGGQQVEMANDSLMVLSGGNVEAYEYRRIGGQWVPHEAILTPPSVVLGQALSMAYDGMSLVTEHRQAFNVGGPPGAVIFWERQGAWVPVQTFTASQLGVHPASTGSFFGAPSSVHGDVAAISASSALLNGHNHVGSVFVMRRTGGVWALEQRIDHPHPTRPDLFFGGNLVVHGDDLFVTAGDTGWTTQLTVHIFHYRRNVLGLWELVDDLEVTPGPGQSAYSVGFGRQLHYAPPTLFVGASFWQVPGSSPGDPYGGFGAVLAFEPCGNVWNQRLVMTAPHEFLSSQLGGRGLDYDGQTVVAGGPKFTGYNGQINPGQSIFEAGIAAVIDYAPLPPGTCLEVGRPGCTPASAETTDCPCGTASPGLGCPNVVGPGARLAVYGSFDQQRVERVTIDGLPPASTTLLVIGTPVLALPAGSVSSGGVWCLGTPLRRFVGVSDASGTVTFEDVPTPFQPTSFSFYELPLQAQYRTPASGPCGHTWNASNAVLLHLDRY